MPVGRQITSGSFRQSGDGADWQHVQAWRIELPCGALIERSLAMVTALAPRLGYDRAAAIAKESVSSGRTVREICLGRLDELGMSAAELEESLDPARMSGP